MRIVHYPDWRSANPYQEHLAQALVMAGARVDFSNYKGGWFPLFRCARRASVLHLHWAQPAMATDAPWSLKFLLRHLLFYLDVLMVKAAKTRLVWTVHNLEEHNIRHRILEPVARRWLALCCDALIVHGPSLQEACMKTLHVPAAKVHAILHGAYQHSVVSKEAEMSARQQLGWTGDAFRFLHFGAVKPYKGMGWALPHWLHWAGPDDVLVVAGKLEDPVFEQAAKTADAKKLQLMDGFVEEALLQRLLAACDAVLLPFERISTSGSLILAMSAGKPIIAPRLGSIVDYLGSDYPFLFDAKDRESFLRALHAARNADQELVRMHHQALLKPLNWEKLGLAYMSLYQNLHPNEGV